VNEHFADAPDGTRLFWRCEGEGSPAIVLTDGLGCAGFIWRELYPRLAERRRVIHWNYRGHGRSEVPRDLERVSLLDCVDDLLTVMDAAGERAAVLAGHSMGVQVCLEAHRRAPGRTLALALLCGSPGRPLDTWHGANVLSLLFPWVKAAVLGAPQAARWVFRNVVPSEVSLQIGRFLEVNRTLLRRSDLERYLRDVSDVDPQVFVRMLGSASEHDAGDHLAEVDVPTLVVAGERDTWTPLSLSLKMHEAVPYSELCTLPGGTHTGPLEHPELVALRLEKFLDERLGPPRRASRSRLGRAPG
jgi:pimeloyl-ACP methyl ester carboxylesterase